MTSKRRIAAARTSACTSSIFLNTVKTGRAEARALFETVWIYTFGVGALCATGVCRFSEERLSQMLTTEFQAMLTLVKSGALKA